jgi:hypothetical protein
MVTAVAIQHGAPIWASPAIVPSRDTVVSPTIGPTLAAITVTSTGIFVYVKVDNTGDQDVGCPTGLWAAPVALSGFLASGTASPAAVGGFRFTAAAGGDTLRNEASGAVVTLGNPASGRRAWGWSSPGNHFFAYAYGPSASGTDWRLKVFALNGATRIDGGAIAPGTKVLEYPASMATPIQYSAPWTANNFRWIQGEAILCFGTPASGTGISRAVACFRTAAGTTYPELVPAGLTWLYRASPCGSRIAFMAQVTPPATRAITFVSTETGAVTSARINNVATPVSTDGQTPTITTNAHTARGVAINPGSGATIFVDDPDGTAATRGLEVRVDRVKASTLPSANLGVLPVGSAAGGPIPPGGFAWVQVPNTTGWSNQGETHWCLLAQAYSVSTAIPQPWHGDVASPPPFPANLPNCAQRNIHITT